MVSRIRADYRTRIPPFCWGLVSVVPTGAMAKSSGSEQEELGLRSELCPLLVM